MFDHNEMAEYIPNVYYMIYKHINLKQVKYKTEHNKKLNALNEKSKRCIGPSVFSRAYAVLIINKFTLYLTERKMLVN